MTTARELMTESPASVGPDWTVRNAVALLQTLDVRHLPVVNEDQELVGMVSDRDLRALSLPSYIDGELVGAVQTALEAPVSSIMSSDVLSVHEEAELGEMIELMIDNKVGALPVTDIDGVLVGIVSYLDVLRGAALDPLAAE